MEDKLLDRWNSVHHVLMYASYDVIAPMLVDGNSYLLLELVYEEEKEGIIEDIEKRGGSCEFVPSDDNQIIFRLI